MAFLVALVASLGCDTTRFSLWEWCPLKGGRSAGGYPSIYKKEISPKGDVEENVPDRKSLLATRPNYHNRDETIRGHVFPSFLALLFRTELLRRIEDRGDRVEWAGSISDLEALRFTEVLHRDQHSSCGSTSAETAPRSSRPRASSSLQPFRGCIATYERCLKP